MAATYTHTTTHTHVHNKRVLERYGGIFLECQGDAETEKMGDQ